MHHTTEIKALTSIRMIAALLVFIHHFYPFAKTGNVIENIFLEGHIGVTIFFVLSGFLLSLRYADTFKDGITGAKFFDYYRKRFARIYPLYAVLLIIAAAPANVIYLLMAQGFFSEFKYGGLPPAWSLTVEECFYLLLPFIVMLPVTPARRIADTVRNMVLLGIALLAIGIVVVAVSNVTGAAAYGGFMSDNQHMTMYTIFGRFFDFAIGIIAAAVYRQRKHIGAMAHVVVIAGILIMATSAQLMHVGGGPYAAWVYNYVVAVGAGLLIFGLAYPSAWARALSHPLPVYMGRISFALYLLQGVWMFWNVGNHIIRTSQAPLYFVAFYAVANIVSAILYECVEKPAQRFILRATARKAPKPAKAIG